METSMKIKELIDLLKVHDPNHDVVVIDGMGFPCEPRLALPAHDEWRKYRQHTTTIIAPSHKPE
jgi:3-deoxy-D-manno-octulosonic-acid transferase